jgi:steroid delta-isomerase-like uncharacterized protein
VSAEENKALVRRWFEELFNQAKLDLADEIVTPDHVTHDTSTPEHLPGPEGERQLVNLVRGAFPDGRITIEDLVAEGDRVAVRWTFRGTHRGDFMGIAPTGKEVEMGAMDLFRVAGGKIAETWSNVDMMTMMHQLGAIPTPAQSGEASPT